jgi:hypothetical protein
MLSSLRRKVLSLPNQQKIPPAIADRLYTWKTTTREVGSMSKSKKMSKDKRFRDPRKRQKAKEPRAAFHQPEITYDQLKPSKKSHAKHLPIIPTHINDAFKEW